MANSIKPFGLAPGLSQNVNPENHRLNSPVVRLELQMAALGSLYRQLAQAMEEQARFMRSAEGLKLDHGALLMVGDRLAEQMCAAHSLIKTISGARDA